LYLAEASALLEHARETDDSVAHLMVIAHNPGLGDLAAQLAPGARFAGFETGATFTMAFPAASWRDLRAGQAQDFRYDSPGRFFDAST
jgi:phosphohistidine phosphatase SixA